MKTTFKKSLYVVGPLLLLCMAASLYAQNNASNHSPRTEITEATILKQILNEAGIRNKEVQMEVVNFSPCSASPAHRHPCPTFGYVLEGEIESVFEGIRHVYKRGDSFYEKPYGLHSVTRNRDRFKSAKLLVFFINGPAKSNSIAVSSKKP